MKKIYIACPAKYATGGPELLHQLCYKLTNFGYDASMYYYGKYDESPVHERYKKYNNKFTIELDDDTSNLIIVPETNVNLLKKIHKSKKVIWWLSVDNYFEVINSKKNKLKSLMGLRNYNYKNKEIIHFVQSKYAHVFLEENNICKQNIYYLSDYLNSTFINQSINMNSDKKDYVLYNPKKGYEFTKKIIESFPKFQWKALENLTPKEMSNLMKQSKVYVDFGNHPGKDRIPREAAISGTCVITGKKGSAKFVEDVTIYDEFKFDDTDSNIYKIGNKIKYILENYEKETIKFKEYRDLIVQEEKKFEDDIKNIFIKIES